METPRRKQRWKNRTKRHRQVPGSNSTNATICESGDRMGTLKLYTSNRLESLTEKLAEVLAQPLSSPLQSEVIIVQSQGMARWLQLELAQRHGICANCSFPFPKIFCAEVLAANSADPGARPT